MRVRFSAPRGERARFRFLTACMVLSLMPGQRAERQEGLWWDVKPATVFWRRGDGNAPRLRSKVGRGWPEGGQLETILQNLIPEVVRKRSTNGDVIDLTVWDATREELPVVCEPGDHATLPAIMLSPLALSVRGQKGRWHDDLAKTGPDLEAAVNVRLSRLTGRNVKLKVEPDRLYLRANPRHSMMVRTRAVNGDKLHS